MLPFRLRVGMALAGAWTILLSFAPASAQMLGNVPFSRYEAILERAPFGAPPPPPPTSAADAESNAAQEEEEVYVIPPGLDKVKVTLISRFRGIPAAGFTDGESNTPYYLLVGQSNDFELVSVDLSAQTIRLRRGEFEADLPLWVNPSTTNQADLASFGMPAGAAPPAGGAVGRVAATPVRTPSARTSTPEEVKRREELRLRREEARKQREAERERQREELAKLTPEERERRLHDINVELIINNSGPPLPVTLDEQDMKKLSDAGFDVPGYPPRSEKATGTK